MTGARDRRVGRLVHWTTFTYPDFDKAWVDPGCLSDFFEAFTPFNGFKDKALKVGRVAVPADVGVTFSIDLKAICDHVESVGRFRVLVHSEQPPKAMKNDKLPNLVLWPNCDLVIGTFRYLICCSPGQKN